MAINIKHRNAFQYWLDSDRKASLSEIAKAVGASKTAVYTWKRDAQWELFKGSKVTNAAFSEMVKNKAPTKKVTKEELGVKHAKVMILEKKQIDQTIAEIVENVEVVERKGVKDFFQIFLSKPTAKQQAIIDLTYSSEQEIGLKNDIDVHNYMLTNEIKEYLDLMNSESDEIFEEKTFEKTIEKSQHKLERVIENVKSVSKQKRMIELHKMIMKGHEHKANLYMQLELVRNRKQEINEELFIENDAMSEAIENAILGLREERTVIDADVL